MSDEKPSLRGRIDFCDGQCAKGWALDASALERSVPVRIFAAGKALGEVAPVTFRWDLYSRGFGSGCHGFVFPIPGELSGFGPVTLSFRFAETGEELENSPVRIPFRDERSWIPYEATDLTGNRVLVMAPHPDDEALACGGSLILHGQKNDPVKVVVLTDGARGGASCSRDAAERVELRQREALAAGEILGVSDIEFWGFPDRGLHCADGVLERLERSLADYAPTLIYAPSPTEAHPDHRSAAELLWRALQRTPHDAQLAFYELSRPIQVNTLVDITGVIGQKRRACDVYRSQLEMHPYTDVAAGLSRYRALTLTPRAEHAEGFFVMPSAEVVGRPVESFAVRQLMPLDRQAEPGEPLVSVVVRTRDRKDRLREALSSLLTQTYANLEVVLVNDGGEEPLDVVAEFRELLRLRYVCHRQSRGRAAAANSGVQHAAGKYLVYLDDDDLLYPRHVEKLVRYLEASGESMAYSDCEQVRYRWTGDRFEQIGEPQLFQGVEFDRDRLYHANFIAFMTAMIRRDLVDETGPFDESLELLEDWDFWIRASCHTNFQRLPGVTALYRVFATHSHVSTYPEVLRKHADYWTPDRLASSIWPRIETLTAENTSQRLKIQELSAELSRLRADGERRNKELEQAATELSDLWNKLRLSQREQRLAEEERAQLLTELDGARHDLHESEQAHLHAQQEAEELLGELRWTQRALQAGEQASQEVQQELARILAELGAIGKELQASHRERSQMEEALRELRSQLEMTTSGLSKAEEELNNQRHARQHAEAVLQLIMSSYSWRASRLIPAPIRRLLKQALRKLARQEPAVSSETSHAVPRGEWSAIKLADGYQIRPYEAGDEGRILQLFSECFGRDRSIDHWVWKYRDHPLGSQAIILAFDPEGTLVAHYGGYPCRFLDATSSSERTFFAYHIGDTMTRPRARGVGMRTTSLLYRVTREFFDRFCEGQVGFNFGFNEGKIRRYYLRLVKGSRFFESAPYKVLDLRDARRAAGLGDSGAYRVERVDQLDERWDELFQRVVPHYRYLIVRDSAYLRWRYLDCPDVDYSFYAAHQDGRLVGWAVFRREAEELVWGDALFDPRHPTAVVDVLNRAFVEHQDPDLTRVGGWFSSNPSWWARLIEDVGFESRPDPFDLGMIFLSFLEPDPIERFRDALYYTKGDGDLF